MTAFALAISFSLTACGGSGPERAATSVAHAMEAFGAHGTTWGWFEVHGSDVTLFDVRASLDGVGPVHAASLAFTGFRPAAGGWQADAVRAESVDGAVKAAQFTLRAPRAESTAGVWTVHDEGRSFEGYEGPVSGTQARVARASVLPAAKGGGAPPATLLKVDGLRIDRNAPGALRTLSGLDWDVSVRYAAGTPGWATIEIERAEAPGWSVRGRIELAGGPGLASSLGKLEPVAILDPARWPAGVLLREADLDMTLARPKVLVGTRASDPVAGSLAGKAAAGGAVSWHVRAWPREPVPVRDLPGILSAPGADARLGLSATDREAASPGVPDRSQAAAFALPPRESPTPAPSAQPGPTPILR